MQNGLHARVRAVNIWLMAPLLGLAVFMAVFAAARPAQAATSSNLNFQARLLSSTGAVVPDGNYNIDFKIYNADSTTGTVGSCSGACLWEETRTNSGGSGVKVINGYFSVNLGSVTAFPSTINWDQPLWLTMNLTTNGTMAGAPVAGDWDGEMQNGGHSIALTALPYSFVAGTLAKTNAGGHRGTLSFNTVANDPAILLPDASGTVCLQGSGGANGCGYEGTSGTDFIQNKYTSAQTANFNIQSAAAGGIGGLIQGAASATVPVFVLRDGSTPGSAADLLQLQDSSSNPIAGFDNTGHLYLGRASGADGTIVIYNSAGSGTATITLNANPTTSYIYQLPTSTVNSGQCLQSGTVSGSNVPLTFGACGQVGTFLSKVTTDTASADAGSGYLYGFTNSGTAGSGGVLNLDNGSNTGTVLNVKGTGTTAFAVTNSSAQRVLGVDTSNKQVLLGQSNQVNGSLLFKNSSNTNGITINSTGASSNYSLTLPSASPAGGLCIETQPGNASQLIFASCSNNNASIQEVAEWDANSTNTVSVSPTTAGDEMVLTTQIPTGGVTVTSVSGGGVTTWNKVVTSAGNGTVNRVEMWAGTVTTTGSSTITVTYSSSPGAEEITATEFTAAGVNANTSWGVESSASQLNSTASATVTYPNMTAVNGSELYVGYAQVQNPPATAGSTTGFSYIQSSTQHNMITYNTSLAANTSYQPTANQNSSGQSNTVSAILTAFVTSSSINNTTSLQKANFYVQAATSGTVAGVLQAASTGTADILDLRNSGATNVFTVGSTGNVAIQPSASASAFKVLNGSGYSVLGVDTSGNQVTVGDATHLSGKITFADSGDSNTISLLAPTSIASSYNLKLPNNTPSTGLCLATSPSDANQLIFSSCATQVSAASITYVNKWDNNGAAVTTISDSPTSIGDLLVFYSHTANNVTVSSLSGGGVTTWYKVTSYTGGGTPGNIEMWRGVVTTTGAGTITVSYSGAAGTNEIVAEEFTMGSANGTWAIDTSGTSTTTSSVATVNYPSLTPLNSNELYTGYAYGGGTMSLSSPTAGFTYVATGASKYLTYKTNVSGGTAYAPVAQQTSNVYASIAAVIEAYTGTSVIVNTTSVQDANFYVQAASAGTVAGILQAATSGSADVFQVKDSSGNNVMSVNPVSGTNYGLTLGTSNVASGQLIFNASSNNNTITIAAPSTPGASYSLTLPTTTPAAGQCLATSPSNASQLVFSSCANQVTSVAISYVNSWKSSGNNISTLSISPASLNNLILFFSSPRNGVSTTGLSGCGITWSKVSGSTAGSGADTSAIDMYKGVTTATGSCTVTASFSGSEGNPNELAAMEFSTGTTTGSWVVDASNTQYNSTASTTMTFPSLTPQSSKDLYAGYGAGGTYSSGGSSGFTYLTGSLTNRVGLYNTNVSATTQPTATTALSASMTVGALIAAYSSSSVISNSTVTQQGNFNVQAATSGSVAGTLQAFAGGTGDIFDLLNGAGTLVGKFTSTGNLLVEPSTASAAAFQVQTTGAVNVLSVDTSANQVVVGAGSTGESSPSLLVVDNETGTSADPTEVNGAIYYNATTHTFRCGVAGAWQNCGGLLYANTSKSSAVSNCSNNCTAFGTYAPIPANYCQAGKVIRLSANGYFSSQASATNIQFGIYYGTDATTAANDVLIGTVSPAASVTSASNNYFQINMDINCFSTSSMQAGGVLGIQTGAAASGLTSLPVNSTTAATVVTSSTKNLYIFPIWSAASASNTATLAQLGVNSP